jgi:serine/threonine protein kinase
MRCSHLDLKPENILITETGVAKICDLGLSEVACTKPKAVGKTEAQEIELPIGREDPAMQELQGTSPYIAPELVSDYRPNRPQFLVSFAADVYSFAIVMWELLHTPLPTHPLSWDPYKILVEVKYNDYRPKVDAKLPNKVTELIRSCWTTNPSERPKLSEVVVQLDSMIEEFSNVRTTRSASSAIIPVASPSPPYGRKLSRSAML